MMQVPAMRFTLSETHAQNLRAATEQMLNLLQRVAEHHEYRLLSTADRNTLLKEGFAHDLVDNLVYLTQRDAQNNVKLSNDKHCVGFTQVVYDPSLYADAAIAQQLQSASSGRCYWCESDLSGNGLATDMVHHFRPPAGYLKETVLKRDAYVAQAYDTDNLLYGCAQCAEQGKGLHFPTIDGRHMPDVGLADERPLLLNPRTENPRDYIRFNPLNGQAFAYDRVQAYYLHKQVKQSEIAGMLWQRPDLIPLQKDPSGNALSSPVLDAEFAAWLTELSPNEAAQLSRGQTTIDVINLNRISLQRARLAHLQALWMAMQFELKNSQTSTSSSNQSSIPQTIDELPLLAQRQFCSLSLDAIATWHQQLSQAQSVNSAQNSSQSSPQALHSGASDDSCIHQNSNQQTSVQKSSAGESDTEESGTREGVTRESSTEQTVVAANNQDKSNQDDNSQEPT